MDLRFIRPLKEILSLLLILRVRVFKFSVDLFIYFFPSERSTEEETQESKFWFSSVFFSFLFCSRFSWLWNHSCVVFSEALHMTNHCVDQSSMLQARYKIEWLARGLRLRVYEFSKRTVWATHFVQNNYANRCNICVLVLKVFGISACRYIGLCDATSRHTAYTFSTHSESHNHAGLSFIDVQV